MNNGGKVNTSFLACTTQSITTRMEATESQENKVLTDLYNRCLTALIRGKQVPGPTKKGCSGGERSYLYQFLKPRAQLWSKVK